jgi:hypothetical protein
MAAVSFMAFRSMVLSIFPSSWTGDAAPMCVVGAIAAIFAAIVMNTPADAARPPLGATYTTIGTSEAIIRMTI